MAGAEASLVLAGFIMKIFQCFQGSMPLFRATNAVA